MEKKKYIKPTMQVIKLQHQMLLQVGSGKRGSYGPAREG